jgi:hypothetical protein
MPRPSAQADRTTTAVTMTERSSEKMMIRKNSRDGIVGRLMLDDVGVSCSPLG